MDSNDENHADNDYPDEESDDSDYDSDDSEQVSEALIVFRLFSLSNGCAVSNGQSTENRRIWKRRPSDEGVANDELDY